MEKSALQAGLDSAFKAYDVRGRLPDEINADVFRRIGLAYADFLRPRKVVVGRDIRLSSAELAGALAEGLQQAGVDVLDIGVCGTEEVYFATFHYRLDGGLMITASHNPKDYNGLKLVREQARPISADTGLLDIKRRVLDGIAPRAPQAGRREILDHRADYIAHLLGVLDRGRLKPLKIVANAGNGGAGRVAGALAAELPFELVPLHFTPDGHFPNGVPNPMLPENRAETVQAVREHGADFGMAWDGDFDRCFFFDEQGRFIESYYLVGLFAELMLRKYPGAKIVHDPRLTWNTLEDVRRGGGEAVASKSGHAFMKEVMRRSHAVYGGEMSAHHYFRDFAYCDSGMLPWLLVAEAISLSGKPLSELIGARQEAFPCSGEINRTVPDPEALLEALEAEYGPRAERVDTLDGVSFEFADWRFNLRKSNTEPVVRLNVETRADRRLLEAKTAELLQRLEDG